MLRAMKEERKSEGSATEMDDARRAGATDLHRFDHLAELCVVDADARLVFELFNCVRPPVALVARALEQLADGPLEVANHATLALARSRVDKIHVDLAGAGIGLRASEEFPRSAKVLLSKRKGERTRAGLTALSLMASRINLPASFTSWRSTVSENLILAWASLNRIILSSCRVVAVILLSDDRGSSPTFRIST